MRDLTTLFVETSMAQGEWLAALNALQLLATSSTVSATAASPFHAVQLTRASAAHHFRIARSLATKGKCVAALSTLRCAPSPLQRAAQPCTYGDAYLAERVRAYHCVLLSYYKKTAQRDVRAASAEPPSPEEALPSSSRIDDVETPLCDVLAIAAEAFQVLPVTRNESKTDAMTRTSPSASSSPSPSSSLSSVPGVVNQGASAAAAAEELLEWCQKLLHNAPAASHLAVEEKHKLLAELQAAAQAALSGAVRETGAPSCTPPASFTDVPAAPSSSAAESRIAAKNSGDTSTAAHANAPTSMRLPPAAAVSAAEKKLHTLLFDARPSWNDWSTALTLLSRMPADRLTPHMCTAVIRLLARRGRQHEFEHLVRAYIFAADLPRHKDSNGVVTGASSSLSLNGRGAKEKKGGVVLADGPTPDTAAVLAADGVVLKTIAEACRRLHSPLLAAELLSNPSVRMHLIPSAAVPLVMVLRDAKQYTAVIEWWGKLRAGEQTPRYPLLHHAKLCSYVASCVLRNAYNGEQHSTTIAAVSSAAWEAALHIIRDAEGGTADPALILLFELRLLRQVRQWSAAMLLFARYCENHPPCATRPRNTTSNTRNNESDVEMMGKRNVSSSLAALRRHAKRDLTKRPSALESAFSILTEERAEQWVPAEPLRVLRAQVSRYKSQIR
jgi:hypothetical protein